MEEVKNPHNLGSKMAALYANQSLCDKISDITFVVGHRKYPLHKIVLCATSPVFQDMCDKGDQGTSITKETVRLEDSEECVAVFSDFVKYLYTGNIRLNLDTVDAIITLADKYQVEDLKEIAKKFQKKHEPGKQSICIVNQKLIKKTAKYFSKGPDFWWHLEITMIEILAYICFF